MHIENSASRLAEIADLVRRETFPSKRLSPLQRFRLFCRRHGVEVVEPPRIGSGFTWQDENKSPVIVLGGDLGDSHREFVAFHEAGHIALRKSMGEHSELEANFFAFLALQEDHEQSNSSHRG